LLFVGSFVHPPNVDAALRLARTIFPALREHYPELELYIVGDQPPSVLKKCSGPKLVVTGTVSDVTPFLDRAAVFVVPAQQGGGIRIKVLEALAAGKAVVASRLAAEGLDVTNGDQISLADSDAEFVERVSRLLDDEDERVSMAKRARAWAGAHMGWDQSIQAYERLYRALLAGTAI
jgi:glycosyltransferase involved in cell wall biosynthesis